MMVKNIQCYLLLTGQVGIRGTGQRDVWDVAGRIQSHLQGWLYLFRLVSRKIPQFPLRFVFKVHRFPVNVSGSQVCCSGKWLCCLDLRFSPGSISRPHYPGDSWERCRGSSI